MKLIATLALVWTCTMAQAALFEFGEGAKGVNPSHNSSTWAVDLATARQWYIAWAASADRVYQRTINPSATFLAKPRAPITTDALLSQSVFVGVTALLAAALISAAKSVTKVMLLSRKQLAGHAH